MRQRGFTLMEMLVVMTLIGLLAVAALPRVDAILGLRGDVWRDELLAALREARSTAIGHRRLVCVDITSTSVRLRIAAANPASSCSAALPGPDGDAVYARSADAALTTTVAPAGTLYFQPGGQVSSDGAGLEPTDRSIAVAGLAPITVVGRTGHVH